VPTNATYFTLQVTDGNKKQLYVNGSAVCVLCTVNTQRNH